LIHARMNVRLARGYTSRSQIVRIISEDWGTRNLYCPACVSDSLSKRPNNTRVVDYICEKCDSLYQLKSSALWNETRIPDAAYKAMINAIKMNSVPNLFIMQYSSDWIVNNLLLVPSFFITMSVIEKRNPLGPTARRAGWVGCNFLLNNIAPEGKIPVIRNGCVIDQSLVRSRYNYVRPFAEIDSMKRSWTLDVFRLVSKFMHSQFSLKDLYCFEQELSKIYPNNKNIRPKIRQQLQVLRDMGIVKFLGEGQYVICR